jgi:glutathione S-transferase
VLEHGDFRLYETQAILRYLDRALPGLTLTPPEPRCGARMDQLMNVNDWYSVQGVGNVIGFQRVVAPKLMGLTPDEAAIAAAMPKAHIVFDALARELGDGAYFGGDSPSLADIMIAPQLDFFAGTPEWPALTAKNPNLVRWMDRMSSRPEHAGDHLGSRNRNGRGGLSPTEAARRSASRPAALSCRHAGERNTLSVGPCSTMRPAA